MQIENQLLDVLLCLENRYSFGIFLHNEYPEVEYKPCFHDI